MEGVGKFTRLDIRVPMKISLSMRMNRNNYLTLCFWHCRYLN